MANRAKLLVVLALVIPLVLTACYTRYDISKGFKLNSNGENGLVIGSLALVSSDTALLDWRLGDVELLFRGKTKFHYEEFGSLSIKADDWSRAFDFANRFNWSAGGEIEEFQGSGTGRFFAVELPIGDYKFFNWTLKGLVSPGLGKVFSLPFKVEPGKVKYLGQLTVHVAVTQNQLEIVRPSAIEFRVYDERERDLAIFTKRYPALADIPVSFEPPLEPAGTRGPRSKPIFSSPVL